MGRKGRSSFSEEGNSPQQPSLPALTGTEGRSWAPSQGFTHAPQRSWPCPSDSSYRPRYPSSVRGMVAPLPGGCGEGRAGPKPNTQGKPCPSEWALWRRVPSASPLSPFPILPLDFKLVCAQDAAPADGGRTLHPGIRPSFQVPFSLTCWVRPWPNPRGVSGSPSPEARSLYPRTTSLWQAEAFRAPTTV